MLHTVLRRDNQVGLVGSEHGQDAKLVAMVSGRDGETIGRTQRGGADPREQQIGASG